MSYNGWANWATWNVNLHLDETEEFAPSTGWEADDVERFVLDVFPNGTSDMSSAYELGEVDWEDLAETWNLDLDIEEDEE